jgi:hypothetical protein
MSDANFVKFNPVTEDAFTRVDNDTNGNPRYVLHFLMLLTVAESNDTALSLKYGLALARANGIGGRKFHNKQYGGGIVFQSYSLRDTCESINQALERATEPKREPWIYSKGGERVGAIVFRDDLGGFVGTNGRANTAFAPRLRAAYVSESTAIQAITKRGFVVRTR